METRSVRDMLRKDAQGNVVLMESTRKPAWTMQHLDGHRFRRFNVKQLSVNCAQVTDVRSVIVDGRR